MAIENDKQLAQLSHLDSMLARATKIEEVTDIRDTLRALEVYAKNIKASIGETNAIVASRIKAERKAGQMIPTQIKRGNQPGSNNREVVKLPEVTLQDLGITKRDSSKWQAIARIPEEEFEIEMARLVGLNVELYTLHFADMMRNADMDNSRQQRIRELSDIAELDDTYNVIYADPPWQYDHKVPTRAIENHYNTVPTDEICAMNIDDVTTNNAILFLWGTIAMLPDAMAVMAGWGFSYKTSMVWAKDKIGLGWYVRSKHELLLIGIKGEFPPPPSNCRPPSIIEAPRLAHSTKPHEVYEIIEMMYPDGRYIELFNRNTRDGWEAWGSE